MQRARAFFYVCAGLFLLAASYQLGAMNAQAAASFTAGGFQFEGIPASGVRASAVSGRIMYKMDENGNVTSIADPVPGTAEIIATNPLASSVVLSNGDVLYFDGTNWVTSGSFGGGAINVQPSTLGQLKARFRDPAAPSGR
jgi:hypothetical protein